ncbi:MAG: DUF4426 domain-containing protein [Thiohalophilus sp.]
MKSLLKWSTTVLLVFSLHLPPALAEQAERFGDYVIHYNTLNTDILNPEVASEYGIKRSKSRAMLNVSVLRESDGKPVKAEVTATSGMMTGHKQTLKTREIREGDALYYISDFPVAHRDTLKFTLRVKPQGSRKTHTFAFQKQFFTE